MAKGVPTVRSQRYKALKQVKEQLKSPPHSDSDVFPQSPTDTQPSARAEGAHRAFLTLRVLHKSLLHATSPGTHNYDILQFMASYISDCEEWHQEAHDRNTKLQQQLDDTNAKLLTQFAVQNAEILKLQDALEKSKVKADFTGNKLCPCKRFPLINAVDTCMPNPTTHSCPIRRHFRAISCINNCCTLVKIFRCATPR